MAKRKGVPKNRSLKVLMGALSKFNWQDHMDKMATEKKEKEDRERRRVREEYLKRALKAGFNRKQAKFLQEEFANVSHEHWDGRVGG